MPAGDAVGKFRRHEQHQNGRDEEEALEEQRQPVLHEHAVERRAGGCNAVAAQADDQQHAQRRDGRVAEEAPALGGHQQIRQHQHQAEADHRRFPG